MAAEPTPELRARIENTIRFLAVDAVEAARSGHPGAPMGLARVGFELFDAHLRFDPEDPDWVLRDRFILSNGHASMLLYALLHLCGFDLPLEEIRRFRQLGSRTPGHPERGHTPGVEVTTGPLGQGFGHGVGMALAARMARARFARDGRGPGLHRVFALVSDGDLMEGISSEAASLAGHLRLGNLIYVYDDNRITIDGSTDLTFTEDVRRRFEAQRWHVEEVDGEDVAGLRAALRAAASEEEHPSLVIARTTIGFGSPGKAGSPAAHGAPLGPEEVRRTREALGWPAEPPFLVPDDVRAYFERRKAERAAERRELDAALEAWRGAHPALAAEWEACRAGVLSRDLPAKLAAELAGRDAATRKHSHAVIQRLAEELPGLVGGSADLAGSNLTRIESAGDVGQGEGEERYLGRNIHYGVREHAMAAITNGINLDGTFRAFAGTFLVFSDYMRPSIRLAALMGCPSVFVFTHDSIFLGEDGPTHQPIEHLDSLRAMPELVVIRPADGVETALAWAAAIELSDRPVALALSRQTLPALHRERPLGLEDLRRGAYVLDEADGDPELVLVASGSEVSLAREAAAALRADGVSVRVVSMPSLDLFAERPPEERARVVPTDGTPVLAVEASRGLAYAPLLGPRARIHGIHRFGASAPARDLAEHFGFTPEAVRAAALEHLGRRP